MYTLIIIIAIIVAVILCRMLYLLFKDKINFFMTGFDAGFSLPDLILLWKVSSLCELESPISLFYSLAALSKCMNQLTVLSTVESGEQSPRVQKILSKLFDYRTKLQNKSDDKKGITSTKSIDKDQPLRIILAGKGVFASKVLNNGNSLVISVPRQRNLIPITAEEWVGKVISVYFWRKGDARYTFDTTVLQNNLFIGESALFLKHSANLIRTQKRKSVRIQCDLPATLFIVKKANPDYSAIETRNGYRCILQDISESGALIKIGGKGIENVRIKLQFQLNGRLVMMFGIIRTVEYHEAKNLSLLHFECTHIEPIMRNEVLSFVYNTMPDSQKEVLEALEQTELDASETMAEELNKVQNASDERINSIENPNMLDKDLDVNKTDTPDVNKDFSADDIEELEEL